VDDHGEFPSRVPAVQKFFADPMHCCKSFGQELFKLVEQRGREIGFDKIDCMQMKCNFTYWLWQNCNKPFHVFVYYFDCVLEHHFGNHVFHKGKKEGGCKYKGNEEMIAKAKEENCYNDKEMEADLYAVGAGNLASLCYRRNAAAIAASVLVPEEQKSEPAAVRFCS